MWELHWLPICFRVQFKVLVTYIAWDQVIWRTIFSWSHLPNSLEQGDRESYRSANLRGYIWLYIWCPEEEANVGNMKLDIATTVVARNSYRKTSQDQAKPCPPSKQMAPILMCFSHPWNWPFYFLANCLSPRSSILWSGEGYTCQQVKSWNSSQTILSLMGTLRKLQVSGWQFIILPSYRGYHKDFSHHLRNRSHKYVCYIFYYYCITLYRLLGPSFYKLKIENCERLLVPHMLQSMEGSNANASEGRMEKKEGKQEQR